MPASLQREINVFAEIPDDALTPTQQAIRDAFNKEIADGTRWRQICPA